MERLIPPWRPWEAVPIALAAVAASVVTATALAAILGSQGGTALLLTGLVFQAALAGGTIAWVAARYRGGVPLLRLRSERTSRDVALGASLGAAAFVAITVVLAPVVVLVWRAITGGPPETPRQLAFDFGPIQVVLGVVVVVLAAPIGEEIFYRAFLYASLRRRFGRWGAAAISAGFFGLSHVTDGPLLFPLLTAFAFGLALLFEWRRSLVAPIAAHAMFNVIGYTLIVMDRV